VGEPGCSSPSRPPFTAPSTRPAFSTPGSNRRHPVRAVWCHDFEGSRFWGRVILTSATAVLYRAPTMAGFHYRGTVMPVTEGSFRSAEGLPASVRDAEPYPSQ
jgi:hypothetical protein